jgi:uncharacterized membrane protein
MTHLFVHRPAPLRASVAPPIQALLVALAMLNVAVVALPPAPRAVVVLPLALLMPGYALLLALFGRSLPLDAAPLLALAALLSMAFYPLLALALYATGLLLRMGSVLGGMDVCVLALTAVAASRFGPHEVSRTSNAGGTVDLQPSHGADRRPLFAGSRRAVDQTRLALWGIGVVVTIVCVGVGVAGATHALSTVPAAPYTAFYLSGRWAHIDTVVTVAPGRWLVVTVGVANDTGQRQVYRLSPLFTDAHWRAYTIVVPPGRTWTGAVSGRMPLDSCLHRLSLTLHQRGERVPLRPLVLWVRTGTASGPLCTGKRHK